MKKSQPKLYVIIGFIALGVFLSIYPAKIHANPKGDGKLTLYSYHNDDVLEVTFRTPKGYDQKALNKINHVMRCRGDDGVHPINLKLIDMLDNIQDHFGAETIEIISGYRSPNFNKFLKESGRNVARESYHTKGMAADIHIDEISEQAIWNYVKSLNSGGAGFYPGNNFVHVDVGPVSTWRSAPPKKRVLTGIELSPNKGWSVITDKNIYRPGEPIKLNIKNEMRQRSSITKNFWYERFRKGKWAEHKVIEKEKGAIRIDSGQTYHYTLRPQKLPHGKYRIVVFTSRDFSIPPVFSNEIYYKKQ